MGNERQHDQLGECSAPRLAMDEPRSARVWPTFVYSYKNGSRNENARPLREPVQFLWSSACSSCYPGQHDWTSIMTFIENCGRRPA